MAKPSPTKRTGEFSNTQMKVGNISGALKISQENIVTISAGKIYTTDSNDNLIPIVMTDIYGAIHDVLRTTDLADIIS